MRKKNGIIPKTIIFCLALAQTSSLAAKAGLPVGKVEELRNYITAENPYTGWQLWPGKGEMYEGRQPHGAYLTTYVNDIAYQSLQKGEKRFPEGSIVVKENYSADKKLAAITAMYRVDGYSPQAGDWYWLKYTPDGSVEAQGQVNDCIGCHSAVLDRDWVFTKKP